MSDVQEARAAAAITHDNIVTIYRVGEFGGMPYMAMQYLEGCSLYSYVISKKKSRLEMPQIVRLVREMALGLAAAHSRGLVHRDIKPSNIWLESPRGRVKLLDFGIATQAGPTRGHLPVQ